MNEKQREAVLNLLALQESTIKGYRNYKHHEGDPLVVFLEGRAGYIESLFPYLEQAAREIEELME